MPIQHMREHLYRIQDCPGNFGLAVTVISVGYVLDEIMMQKCRGGLVT
jgi:hypothetical protein